MLPEINYSTYEDYRDDPNYHFELNIEIFDRETTDTDLDYIENDRIEADSLRITKSIASGPFDFGGCEASSLSVTVHSDTLKSMLYRANPQLGSRSRTVKDYPIVAWIAVYDDTIDDRDEAAIDWQPLFTGYIDKTSYNLRSDSITITAYDIFYLMSKNDGSRLFNTWMFDGQDNTAFTVVKACCQSISRLYKLYPFYDPQTQQSTQQLVWRSDSGTLLSNEPITRNRVITLEKSNTVVNQDESLVRTDEKVNINVKNWDLTKITQVTNTDAQGNETSVISDQYECVSTTEDIPQFMTLSPVQITLTHTENDTETVTTYSDAKLYINRYSFLSGKVYYRFIYYENQAAYDSRTELFYVVIDRDDGEWNWSYSGNYISEGTSMLAMLKSFCQLNGLYGFVDSYGRIVLRSLDNYSTDPPHFINDVLDDVSIGSYDGIQPIKQVIIRNSEDDIYMGRYPDVAYSTDGYGDYNGQDNIWVLEQNIYIADLKKPAKMALAQALHTRLQKLDISYTEQRVRPPYGTQTIIAKNNPNFQASTMAFNPVFEPLDFLILNASSNYFIGTMNVNMEITGERIFKMSFSSDMDEENHWFVSSDGGGNIGDPSSSGLSSGGGGGGVNIFVVDSIPTNPRSGALYFIATDYGT